LKRGGRENEDAANRSGRSRVTARRVCHDDETPSGRLAERPRALAIGVLKISLATAERHWTYARTWLYAELKDRDGSEES
jgi:hypothetical protein